MAEKRKDKRVNDILLGPLERPALKWLASKMPKWVTPDILTGIGVLAAFLSAFSYYMTNFDKNFLWVASLGFVINWFGDSLDGNLARYRKIERPKYGFFIDHTVDTFAEFVIMLGIGLSPYVQFEIAMVALIGYLLMSIFVFIKTYVRGVFQLSYSKIGPTEVRVVIILANTLIYFIGNPKVDLSFTVLSVYDLIAIIAAIILIALYLVSMLKEAVILNNMEKTSQK